ncbi:RrF2 family transcriptional regulator [Urechidicola vernalis]|uniref:Rrf2 family transcriptional regulator n=1 Tax=Urechidicola vernalis TaxID=3075600 RepID=A0ABU2Y7K3_9FLAO|nr:Rrf2 family transcriptional regulator [Urechidicola sp. P050]MDT0553770.1 Rrf2 family transcriptional regulator [Urechidicola sp. P050]
MLSNACKYAIRSVLYLAIHSNESKKIGVKAIAEELETPQPFLAKLLQQLSRDNLVSSTKGPNGGFFLSDMDKQNAIWNVIESIDGTDKFDNCFLGLKKCNGENPCPVHFIVAPFKETILADFRDKTIEKYVTSMQGTRQVITLKDLDKL